MARYAPHAVVDRDSTRRQRATRSDPLRAPQAVEATRSRPGAVIETDIPARLDALPLDLSNSQIGLAGSCYLAGAALGAFFFGWLTDRLGRKKLFFMTLTVYLLATAAAGLARNAWSFVLFRFLSGTGIGGEYTAINSARSSCSIPPLSTRRWDGGWPS